MWLFHKKAPEARLAGWSFVALAVLFIVLSLSKPAVGLSGLGAIMILAAMLIEANKDRIWEDYVRHYKHRQSDSLPKEWSEPNRLYYQLNVYFAWPLVFVLGLFAIGAAYSLG
jgi:hypothetical protein